MKTLNNPFFVDIEKGVTENVPKGYSIITRAGSKESDVASQIQTLQSIIDEFADESKKDISGVIITPTSSKNELIPYLKQIKEKGIPIIIVDTKIETAFTAPGGLDSLPYIGSSNYEGGKQAARFISDKLPNGGNILILKGVEGQESAEQRNLGFTNVINDSIPNLKYTVRVANWNRGQALTIVSSFYSSGKNFDAIFGANDEMALGALQALKNEGIKNLPVIVGFDATEEARKSVKEDNGLTATIAQDPFFMGSKAISLVAEMNQGKKVEVNNQLKTQIVTK